MEILELGAELTHLENVHEVDLDNEWYVLDGGVETNVDQDTVEVADIVAVGWGVERPRVILFARQTR